MTTEDATYAAWLNLLGTDEVYDTDVNITADLYLMRKAAEASHPQAEVR
jgi:hypothetical protein